MLRRWLDDRAKGLVELLPERVGFDQRCDLLADRLDLTGERGKQLGEQLENRRLGDEAALILLGGAQLDQLAQPDDQGRQALLRGADGGPPARSV